MIDDNTAVDNSSNKQSLSAMLQEDVLKEGIRKLGFSEATPIQAAAIPVALSGKDLILEAKTGSGKLCFGTLLCSPFVVSVDC